MPQRRISDAMEIVRKELSSNELFSATLRYAAGTDEVEYSPDNGTTWYPAPNLDPRRVAYVPAPETADPACDGAARIVAHYQALVEMVISGIAFGTTTVVTNILFLLFPQFALLIIIISLVVNQLIGIGADDLANAFLGTEWDDFLCILAKHIGADGFMNEAGFDLVRADVNAQIGGTAATVLNLLMDMTGFGGMNDAAGQRTETGDCGDCGCPFPYFNGSGLGGLQFRARTGGLGTPTWGRYEATPDMAVADLNSGDNTDYLDIFFPEGTWTAMEINLQVAACGGGSCAFQLFELNGSPTPVFSTNNFTALNEGDTLNFGSALVGAPGTGAWMRVKSSNGGGDGTNTWISMLCLHPV